MVMMTYLLLPSLLLLLQVLYRKRSHTARERENERERHQLELPSEIGQLGQLGRPNPSVIKPFCTFEEKINSLISFQVRSFLVVAIGFESGESRRYQAKHFVYAAVALSLDRRAAEEGENLLSTHLPCYVDGPFNSVKAAVAGVAVNARRSPRGRT